MSENPYGNSNPYAGAGGDANPYQGQQDNPYNGASGQSNPYAGGPGGLPAVREIQDPYQPQGRTLRVVSRSTLGGTNRSFAGTGAGASSAMGVGVDHTPTASGAGGGLLGLFIAFTALLTFSKAAFVAAILAAALLGISKSSYVSAWAATLVNVLVVYLGLALVFRVVFWVVDRVSDLLLVDFSLFWLRVATTLLLLAFAVLAFTGRSVRVPRPMRLVGN